MDLMIFGDSLAGPYGIAPLPAWSDLLAQQEPAVSRIIVKNGYTTADLLGCLNQEVLDLHPSRVWFIGGTNDALRLKAASQIAASAAFLAKEIIRSGAKAIWLMPPLIDADQAAKAYGESPVPLKRAAGILSELHRIIRNDSPQWGWIDLEEIRRRFLSLDKAVYIDGIHFSPAFQRYLAEALRSRVSS